MFKFFIQKKWFIWSILGSIFILSATAFIVYIDVQINKWFGEFYDVLQKALSDPGSVSLEEFLGWLYKFAKLAAIYIIVLIFSDFFTSHYTFRWRTAMADFYHNQWNKAHLIEGASQRVQEDTLKFARIMEGLGVELLRSIMTLVAFLPILYTLSEKVTELPWFGQVNHSMVWVAVITALGGTVLLAAGGGDVVYWFVRNSGKLANDGSSSVNLVTVADAGGATIATLGAEEFMFVPVAAGEGLKVTSATAAVFVEYLYFTKDV